MGDFTDFVKKVFVKKEPLTICIPVFEAEGFVLETLQSVLNQSYGNFKCLISIDFASDNTFEVIRSFSNDKRISIFRQKRRLGWVGNVNFLLKKVRSKYVCIMPHDDILFPSYIDKLMQLIESDERTVVAFSDIEMFGNGHNGTIVQESVRGSKTERATDFIEHHYNAVLFRGIVNRKKVGHDIFLKPNDYKDFGEDTVWGLRMALHGDLIRYPEVLYQKQYLNTSYHRAWQQWPLEKKIEAWIYHCKVCFESVVDDEELCNLPDQLKESIMTRFYQEKLDLYHRSLLIDHLKSEEVTAKAISEIFKIYG